jgi:predicted HTH transcriptional regulator
MKYWEKRALIALEKSFKPIPAELNELDWKSELSNNSEKFARHLSAFSNLENGGFMIFGVNNDLSFRTISQNEVTEIIKKTGNIARNNLAQPVTIDHCSISYQGYDLLFLFIPESPYRPVHLKGGQILESYKRSAGQTVKMSADEIRVLLAHAQNLRFEDQIAESSLTEDEVLDLIDYDSYFRMSGKSLPENKKLILDVLSNEGLLKYNIDNSWNITNIGAILFATDLRRFKDLKRKAVRVVIYKSNDRIEAIKEQEGGMGYAARFEGLVRYIMDQLPTNEVIENAIRKNVKMYPEVAIREIVANALIHQDFTVTGSGVLIEIFSDRIEITNPGVPLIDINRFIDTAPKSRNEALASLLRRLNVCEERGSGIDRAIAHIEAYQLPAPKFIREADYTKVILYAHKTLTRMDKEDRVRACYQHCCLHHISDQKTNNQSIRERFSIDKSNYPMASRILTETVVAGYIKLADPKSTSKKHSNYIPFWA